MSNPELDKPDGICRNCKCDLWNETGPDSSKWGWTCLPSSFVRTMERNRGEAWNTGCGLDKWASYSEWAREEPHTKTMAKHVPMDPLAMLVILNTDSRDDINITPARKRQLELLNKGK